MEATPCAFLRETTIHGLRYVADATTPAGRALWATLTAVSFAAAATVITLNVRGWIER
jgi:hypothetical protein